MFKRILGITAAGILMAAAVAHADPKPIQLALTPEIELVPADESIKGLRLNIYGENKDVMGLSLGFVNKSTGNTSGVELGLVDLTEGEFHGWQYGWAYAKTEGRFIGLQNGIVTYTGGNFTGLQYGLVDTTAGNYKGVQVGLVAITKGDFSGWQAGSLIGLKENLLAFKTGLLTLAKQISAV